MRELITETEAAKRLGVCRKTMVRAMKTETYETEVLSKRKYFVWDTDRLVRATTVKKEGEM